MTTHELKTEKMFFEEVFKGTKKFELRKNVRNFKVGDELWLKEIINWENEVEPKETGRVIAVNVIGILHGPIFGLREGWCIMSIEEL